MPAYIGEPACRSVYLNRVIYLTGPASGNRAAAHQRGAGGEGRELLVRQRAVERRHAAIRARKQPLGRHMAQRRSIVAATCSGVSASSLATSIAPTSTSLPASSPSNSIGTCELAHSSETWSIRLAASAGKIRSYCRHSRPSPLLPLDIGRDAVAVADMDRGAARQVRRRPGAAPRCPRRRRHRDRR